MPRDIFYWAMHTYAIPVWLADLCRKCLIRRLASALMIDPSPATGGVGLKDMTPLVLTDTAGRLADTGEAEQGQ